MGDRGRPRADFLNSETKNEAKVVVVARFELELGLLGMPRLAEEDGPVSDLQSLPWNDVRDFPQCSDFSPEGRVVNEPHMAKARVFMGEKKTPTFYFVVCAARAAIVFVTYPACS